MVILLLVSNNDDCVMSYAICIFTTAIQYYNEMTNIIICKLQWFNCNSWLLFFFDNQLNFKLNFVM